MAFTSQPQATLCAVIVLAMTLCGCVSQPPVPTLGRLLPTTPEVAQNLRPNTTPVVAEIPRMPAESAVAFGTPQANGQTLEPLPAAPTAPPQQPLAPDIRQVNYESQERPAQLIRPAVATATPPEELPNLTTGVLPTNAYPLDLGTALRLAGAQNAQIMFAQAQVQQAAALVDSADARWLPSLRGGVSWNRHEGTLQDTVGNIVASNRNSFYSGMGAGPAGAGPPMVPGLQASFSLADAFYRPLAARQQETARAQNVAAVTNDTLYQACIGYLDLLRANQDAAITGETLTNTQRLADLTGKFARSGQGLQADAERLQAELMLRRNDAERAAELIAVASARLVEVLRLTPDVQLQATDAALAPWNLVNAEIPLSSLLAQGQGSRAELGEARALIGEAQENLRREELGPLLPNVALGLSYGGFGGGIGGGVDNFRDRIDFDALAYWELRNLGIGDHAAQRSAQAQVQIAAARHAVVLQRIQREIAEAYAQVQTRRRQIDSAKQGITAAVSSLEKNLVRIQNVQGLPIEALQSIQSLATARREYLRAVTDYNAAQFALLRAVGWHLQCIDLATAGISGR